MDFLCLTRFSFNVTVDFIKLLWIRDSIEMDSNILELYPYGYNPNI